MDDQARSIEATGETVDSAIEAGLAQLGVTRDQVEVEVIREESRGVLGIGARDAVVRLTEIEPSEMLQPVADPEPEPEPEAEPEAELEAESEPQVHFDYSQEEILNIAQDVLADLLEKMQIEVEIDARISEPRYEGDSATLFLDLQGNDLSFLIGRKGETLAAIQHLLRLMVNNIVHRRAHLVVDVEGYKVRRETALKKLALRIADQVTRRQRLIALEPMNAYERRIIHVTLRNHPTVLTESVGEGTRRKVTIVPKS